MKYFKFILTWYLFTFAAVLLLPVTFESSLRLPTVIFSAALLLPALLIIRKQAAGWLCNTYPLLCAVFLSCFLIYAQIAAPQSSQYKFYADQTFTRGNPFTREYQKKENNRTVYVTRHYVTYQAALEDGKKAEYTEQMYQEELPKQTVKSILLYQQKLYTIDPFYPEFYFTFVLKMGHYILWGLCIVSAVTGVIAVLKKRQN